MGARLRSEAGLFGAAQHLRYRVGGGWSLVWSCSTCGGAVLPLAATFNAADLDYELAQRGKQVGGQTCPGCQTLAMRSNPAGAEPAVWYDTLLHDWVVRLPCHGVVKGAVMPLDVFWCDAPLSLVIRLAADVVYAGDVLEDLDHD